VALSIDRVRAFVALAPSLTQARRLAELQRELRGALGSQLDVAWVPPSNFHVTLKFFGSIPREASTAVADALGRGLAAQPPLQLSLRGVGALPDSTEPRVLWAGLSEPNSLVTLAASVEEWMAALGFEREPRPYRPHLTLGRVRPSRRQQVEAEPLPLAPGGAAPAEGDSAPASMVEQAAASAGPTIEGAEEPLAPVDLGRWAELDLGSAWIHEVVLYESHPLQPGAEYRDLARISLGGGGAAPAARPAGGSRPRDGSWSSGG
jgi:2'-5' RNA ligase